MRARSAGFSLFELVVYILSVAIIYALASNRFAEFPGQAERANFLAVTTQIQSAVNLEMIVGMGLGRISSAESLVGANPMELLLEPPSNYLGAFAGLDQTTVSRRAWYFDQDRSELVYLVNDTTDVFIVPDGQEIPTDEIRFSLVADYSELDRESGLPAGFIEQGAEQAQDTVLRFDGIVMRPVIPFRWGRETLEAAGQNSAGV